MGEAKQLAKIERVAFGTEDHGVWTLWLHMKYDGAGQGFGGFVLDEWSKPDDRRIGSAAGMDFVMRVCAALGVDELSKLRGITCWAIRKDDSFHAPIVGLRQLETEGKGVFLVEEWRKRWFPGEKP